MMVMVVMAVSVMTVVMAVPYFVPVAVLLAGTSSCLVLVAMLLAGTVPPLLFVTMLVPVTVLSLMRVAMLLARTKLVPVLVMLLVVDLFADRVAHNAPMLDACC